MSTPTLLKTVSIAIIFFLLTLFFSPTAIFASYYTSYTIITNVGTPTGGGGPPPNNNTCGKYDLSKPFQHQNFGDPLCDFTKNGLSALLQQLDPKYWDVWYSVIVPAESSYNPNAIQANDPVDPNGAWGLFQMGTGANGQYDYGNVYWKTQASNAINYNKQLNQKFTGKCGALGTSCPAGQPQTWCYWSTAPKNMLCQPL